MREGTNSNFDNEMAPAKMTKARNEIEKKRQEEEDELLRLQLEE